MSNRCVRGGKKQTESLIRRTSAGIIVNPLAFFSWLRDAHEFRRLLGRINLLLLNEIIRSINFRKRSFRAAQIEIIPYNFWMDLAESEHAHVHLTSGSIDLDPLI